MTIVRIFVVFTIFLFSQAVQAEEMPTFELVTKDGYFKPERIEVPAGKRFRLAIRNEGSMPEEFESIELHKEAVLAAGVTRIVVFMPMQPGVYAFFGEFHPETAKGQLIVK